MKILMLTGSPHKEGTTALLADEYCVGAEIAGRHITRFDTAGMDINPCRGCNYCRRNEGQCIQRDEMIKIYPHLLEASVIVFVTPLYYFGMSAQLKKAIDRFYAVNNDLRQNPKLAYLLTAGNDKDDWAMDGIRAHFSTMCRYLNWTESGMVLALGAGKQEDLKDSIYLEQARGLGGAVRSSKI